MKRYAFMEFQRHADERRPRVIVLERVFVCAGAPADSLGAPAPWSQQQADVDSMHLQRRV
jgi:hypothetical protein